MPVLAAKNVSKIRALYRSKSSLIFKKYSFENNGTWINTAGALKIRFKQL